MGFEKDLNQVRALIKSNELKKAELYLSKMIADGDTSAQCYFELGNIYHQRGEVGRAIKSYKKTLEIDNSHTDASISLSVLLNDVGQYGEARNVFETADRRVKSGKANSLIGILEPFSSQGNIDLLKRAGFKDICTVSKLLCFEGFLAIK